MEDNCPFVMDYGTFLEKFAPLKPNIDTEMKKMKTWIEISEYQRETLIERLSLLLIWLFKEKQIKGTEMSMRLGFPGSDLSMIKNKNAKLVSDWKVILIAVSFKIEIDGFNPDKHLGDIKTNKWDSPFFDHPLASNLYHEEIEYFNSWYGKHEREMTEKFKIDQAEVVMAGSSQQLSFNTEMEDLTPAPDITEKKPVIAKPLASFVKEEEKPEMKNSSVFNTIAGAIIEGQKISKDMEFNYAKSMPKESGDVMAKNQIALINSSNDRKKELQEQIKHHESEIETHQLSLQTLNTELSAIARLLKLYGQ